ncbi:MAG: hypothetical protein C5B51_00790 [Terriglobia bacterium]|nr:MAG: hypothetical protein C5B51_00790 [Terriglobia bacterium]
MQRFATVRDAKEFLIGRIADEAQREGIAVSEVERKMLYFSETGWTLPDIAEVNETFDREYDQEHYEHKIAKLIRSLRVRHRRDNADEFDAWTEAVEKLRDGDHYLLVVIEKAGVAERPRGDLVRLIVIALAISGVLVAIALFMANR